jgi:ADP-ribose pyrophosphatase YjhB (NUDIX family)
MDGMTFCPTCGSRLTRAVPEGDTRLRHLCPACGTVHYQNPKVVVGSVCTHEGRILLCRRAIEPRREFWTLPAGYLELHETTEECARREAYEEARADIDIRGILAVYNIPRIGQVQVIYRALLRSARVRPGPESLEVGLFLWDEIPWTEIAFPSVRWALDHHRHAEHSADYRAQSNPAGEAGGL